MNPFIKQFGKPEGLPGKILGKIMTVSNRKMHLAVLSELNKPSKLLEIGFGPGAQLEMIYNKYPAVELYGIDISEDMLKMTTERLGDNAVLSLCDCSKMPFADSSFDTVITTDTCYFWKDHEKTLGEIRRITGHNGRFIMAYNAMYADAVHKSDRSCGMYNDETICRAVRKAKMKIVCERSCGYKQKIFVIRT